LLVGLDVLFISRRDHMRPTDIAKALRIGRASVYRVFNSEKKFRSCDIIDWSADGRANAHSPRQRPRGNMGFGYSTRQSQTASPCTARDW
jgi:hypothetical protein